MANYCSTYVIVGFRKDSQAERFFGRFMRGRKNPDCGRSVKVGGKYLFDVYLNETGKNMVSFNCEVRWGWEHDEVLDLFKVLAWYGAVDATLTYNEDSNCLNGEYILLDSGNVLTRNLNGAGVWEKYHERGTYELLDDELNKQEYKTVGNINAREV